MLVCRNTALYEKSFQYDAVKIYNSLPIRLQETDIKTCIILLRNHIKSRAFYSEEFIEDMKKLMRCHFFFKVPSFSFIYFHRICNFDGSVIHCKLNVKDHVMSINNNLFQCSGREKVMKNISITWNIMLVGSVVVEKRWWWRRRPGFGCTFSPY